MNEKWDAIKKYTESLHKRYELSKEVGPDYFNPGMMENLAQYEGILNDETGTILLRTEVKGLRYDNRSEWLDDLSLGDFVELRRDKENRYNENNFLVFDRKGHDIGTLPAELCNAMANGYDMGELVVEYAKVSYLERLSERSRYAKQGILFLEILLNLKSGKFN